MTVADLTVLLIAIVSGATASVVGFGIGSLLTPLMAVRFGMPVAVAAVMIPHAVATAIRCWRLRAHIDRGVLARFGVLSAIGALIGAIAYTRLGPTVLARVLGVLLLLTAVAQLSGWAARWRPSGTLAAGFGFLSGLFGGLAGNQGGLRSAALVVFNLPPARFVATATATGLIVDAIRAPVYLWHAGSALLPLWQSIAIAAAGVTIGTVLGERLLLRLSRERFAQVLGVTVGLLGIWLLVSAP